MIDVELEAHAAHCRIPRIAETTLLFFHSPVTFFYFIVACLYPVQYAAPTAEDGVFTLHEDTLSALTAPLDDKLSTAVSAVRDATATLAECVDGFWALLPFSLEEEETDYFPIYLVSLGNFNFFFVLVYLE